MGDTISSLVFRPPPPTPIHPSDFFYLDVDVHSPLCTNKSSYRRSAAGDGTGSVRNGGGGNTRSSDSHERNRFVGGTSTGGGGGVCGHFDDDDMIASHSSGSGCFGGAICLDPTSESDLASLDASYLKKDQNRGSSRGRCSPSSIDFDNQNNSHHTNYHDKDVDNDAASIPKNIRNGQVYKIPAFFIRRRNATRTLLFSHGNAEDLGMMYPRMKDLALVLGVNVLAYEYTGYGLSVPGPTTADGNENWKHTSGEGKLGGGRKSRSDSSISGSSNEGPSENMIYRNIEAAYRYLTHDRKIPPQQIILYGRSVGSGPSCYLAAKTALSGNSVGGLVLHSPFLSVYKVVADLNGLDMRFAGDLFQNERRARNIRCPTFIIHG